MKKKKESKMQRDEKRKKEMKVKSNRLKIKLK